MDPVVIPCFKQTLARMVCSLFSSFRQCKKTDEKIGSEKSARLTEGGARGGGSKGRSHKKELLFF